MLGLEFKKYNEVSYRQFMVHISKQANVMDSEIIGLQRFINTLLTMIGSRIFCQKRSNLDNVCLFFQFFSC